MIIEMLDQKVLLVDGIGEFEVEIVDESENGIEALAKCARATTRATIGIGVVLDGLVDEVKKLVDVLMSDGKKVIGVIGNE